MAITTTGVVYKDKTDGTLHIDFCAARNAEEVKAFLQANVGQEVEIFLTTKEELQLVGVSGATNEGEGLDRKDLSPCASAHYWQGKDKKGS